MIDKLNCQKLVKKKIIRKNDTINIFDELMSISLNHIVNFPK